MTFQNQNEKNYEDFMKDFNNIKEKFLGDGLKKGGPIVVILLVVIAALTTFYSVEPDEEAVVIRFGKYSSTNPPGLHFKIPFGVDSVIKVKTKRVLQAEFGFRTKDVNRRRTQYSSGNFEDESLMLTGDLNVANVEWVVQYQISDPFKYLFQTSSPERNIRDVSESIMRRVVGDRSVSDVLTTGKVEVEAEAKLLGQQVLDKYDLGIKIMSVKLQDVNPPQIVKASFNEVNEAKQEQEKVINQAEGSYNEVIPEARGKADKLLSEAEGYAGAQVNRAIGDANKFASVLKEYRKAPLVTRKRMYIETMEKVMSRVDDMTLVDSKVKGIMPIFNQRVQGVTK